MPHLEDCFLPQYYLYGDVLSAASRLKLLSCLTTTWGEKRAYDEHGMQFSSDEGWFENLLQLGVDAHPPIFTAFLAASTYPNREFLSVGTRRLADHNDLMDLCKAVAGSCPAMRNITLNLHADSGQYFPTRPIDFNTFRPLLACRYMDELEIAHDYPITLNDSDLTEMGAFWPRLKALDSLQPTSPQ